ncbi:LOW QUALITY PROTEIN: uncharacterized protein BDZ83DRAFT_723466 [Colletotrichum acutatum]|uniref:Rhodopsin domain-containing protein n=1 Tax=Glomerella acutata TaxID=27357 RepID=A0AAD8UD91_GLOAC|nr:LOW QUALITY PROTEIN: uncharacterized protein BDZ83DRAFT_723466 [Colletotrichum acutatum]KAK1713328.1 LOW QUALITY PROTEIN: hypothetical protein BDZ83DRAFT_723466 [Colletotrichum acutatum]
MIIAVCWTFTALGLIFVGGRLFGCAILSNTLVTILVSWGNGKHFTVLNLEQKQNTVKWMIAAYVPRIETLGFPKLAVIALLTRLLAPGKLHLRSMGIICCLSLTAFSAFLDFYLAVYPAVVLWKLHMRFQKKLALTCALGMGIISGCAGIVKATGVPTLSSQDVSYIMFKGRSIWSLAKKSGSYQYNSHSKKSAQQQQQQPQQDSIELRSKPRKKVDVYGFTMHAKEDSEESIVNPGKNAETSSSGRQSDTYPESEDKVVKSSTVTITYDQGEEGPTSAAT